MFPNMAEVTLEELLVTYDDPTLAEDVLDRAQFARRVATGLRNWKSRESLVVAIYGPWGSGKTWLLEQIEAELAGDSGVEIVRFSPWQFSSTEQIVAEFFEAIYQRLDSIGKGLSDTSPAKNRAEVWRRFGVAMTVGQLGMSTAATLFGAPVAVPGVLGAVARLMKLGQKEAELNNNARSIETLREELIELFSEEDTPKFLIAIDDLDRLEDEQIRLVFRLLKALANFPGLNYLILGERQQLASALNGISSNQGDRYLEKIVQFPITIPQNSEAQLNKRLKEGVERIANECNYDLERKIDRFEAFWREFLREKLTQFRSVHRLLKTVLFHSQCLTQNGVLEVDLLDLLGIDFIRIFDPSLYERLESMPIDGDWMSRNALPVTTIDQQEDSALAHEYVCSSELSYESAFYMLAHLFPGFQSLLPKAIVEKGLSISSCLNFGIGMAERPIWHDEFQHLYFHLGLENNPFPVGIYREFVSSRESSEMISKLEYARENNWIHSLLLSIENDQVFWEGVDSNADEILSALSWVSDDVGSAFFYSRSSEGRAQFLNLWSKVFRYIPKSRKLRFIKKLVRQEGGVTISLFLIEELRYVNGFAEFELDGIGASVPDATLEEIEEMADELFQTVRERFLSRRFPVDYLQSSRFFRLAHAMGVERVESLLREDVEKNGPDACFAILGAVAIKHSGDYGHVDLLDKESVGSVEGLKVIESLVGFASENFWLAFLNQVKDRKVLEEFQQVVLNHLSNGLKYLEETCHDSA